MKSNQVFLLACALVAGALALPGPQEAYNLHKRDTGADVSASLGSTNDGVNTQDHAEGYPSAYQREKAGEKSNGKTTEMAEW